tara:strand:+ start:1048 stop:1731 length:684 start_codon:yes stop_codon:yes gene_type:complete
MIIIKEKDIHDASKNIINRLKSNNKINSQNIVISGGNSTKNFSNLIAKDKSLILNLILSDERLVELDPKYSNSYYLEQTLNEKNRYQSLIKILPPSEIFKTNDNYKILTKFDNLLKNKVVEYNILGIGSDGHIASIFDNSIELASGKYCKIIKNKNEKFNRITLNMNFLSKSKNNFFLLFGKNKSNILEDLVINNDKNYPIQRFIKKIDDYIIFTDEDCCENSNVNI